MENKIKKELDAKDKKIQKAITQIMSLCYQINILTGFCAFCEYKGHIEGMNIYIARTKKNYDVYVSNIKTIYFDKEDVVEELTSVMAKLSIFLQKNKGKEDEIINL